MQHEVANTALTALTIAGFDPSSGAGITADLAVFAAHGIFGTSCITALTVQSTMGVRRSELVPPALLAQTLACLQDDLPPQGIKIGMLGGVEQVRVVVEYLRPLRMGRRSPLVVLDPILQSSSGASLLSDQGVALLLEDLLPLVDVVTPNRRELCVLTGVPCATPMQTLQAARSLTAKYGGVAAIVTGGDEPEPHDLLVQGDMVTALQGERIETTSTHGTGCAFSSALLCHLLAGEQVPVAALGAKRYVEGALRMAVPRGSGRGPMNLMWPISEAEE